MLTGLKKGAYFLLASYFRFWANIQLRKWHPRIVVITGSNGKTTTLHLVEAQMGNRARYSHKANSSFGIPFDILGLQRKTFYRFEWFQLLLLAPIRAFKKPYPDSVYIIEADCDRPGEGEFLAAWLKPEVVIWLNTAKTHSQYFDKVVSQGKSPDVETAVAHEFGSFLAHCRKLAIISDQDLISRQLSRTRAGHRRVIEMTELADYKPGLDQTIMKSNNRVIRLPALVPKETFYSVMAAIELNRYLHIDSDYNFSKFHLPPGRSSVFTGVRRSTLVDSSYNANLSSTMSVLSMFMGLSHVPKWLVLGDFVEQGEQEQVEHERLGEFLNTLRFDKLVLLGPRLREYALPKLSDKNRQKTVSFLGPDEVLKELRDKITGGEIILFKGARFLEGVVEHLLANPADAEFLCRQEPVWRERRKKWGL